MIASAKRRRPLAAAPRGRRKLTTEETTCLSRHAEIATLPPRRRRAGGTRKGRQDQGAPDRSEALLQPLEIIVADLFEIAPAELLGLAALSLSLGEMAILATVLALMPLALALGAGAQLMQPLAIAVMGGFLLSGPAVLLLVPGLYRLLDPRGGLAGSSRKPMPIKSLEE
ncbi:MAG: efflux RND transporter permease subunit [Deltaproteobacteria bacterium]|nr:MAG: efflux RND transporter permease subunit [Deltaproteobacteria bacterium]